MSYPRLLPACGALFKPTGGGPLAFDAADGDEDDTAGTSHTYANFPGIAPDKVAVRVLVLGFSGLTINSVTYGGVDLGAAVETITSGDGFRKVALYGKTGGLPTGSRDVVVSYNQEVSKSKIIVTTVTGGHATNTFSDTETNSGTSALPTITIPGSAADEIAVDGAMSTTDWFAFSAGQTEDFVSTDLEYFGSHKTATGANTVMSEDLSGSGDWLIVAGSFAKA